MHGMKRLQCEMCGGGDFVKDSGFFVCSECGCKYTVEEARHLMSEDSTAVQSTGTLTDIFSAPTVKAERNAVEEKVNAYLERISQLFEDRNGEAVLECCEQVLAMDSENPVAWAYKAKAASWGSTFDNIRIHNAIEYSKKAVELVPDERKPEVAADIYPYIKESINSLLSTAITMPAATAPKFIHVVFMEWLAVLTNIPFLSDELIDAEIAGCKKLCNDSKEAVFMPVHIYTAYCTYNDGERYDKAFRLGIKKKFDAEQAALEALEESNRIKRQVAYWEEHQDEKEELEQKLKELREKKEKFLEKKQHIAAQEELRACMQQLDATRRERDALGMFKSAQKKELQAKIKELSDKVAQLKKDSENERSRVVHEIELIDEEIEAINKTISLH